MISGRLLGFHLSNIDRVLLREYSPADNADHAEECSKLHYHAEKDRLFEVKAVLGFRGFVCVNLRDQREIYWGFFCADRLSTLACILPQITQITQTNAARAALSRRERQIGEVNVVLGFWVSSA